jgi:predicted TIM-barrel fold metal-dependent hydrolase
MRVIDFHSHYPMKEYSLYSRTPPEQIELAEKQYGFRKGELNRTRTEEEMVQDLRKEKVKVILDFGFTMELPIEELRVLHDYAMQLRKTYPELILGTWATINPQTGLKGLRELERGFADGGIFGFGTMGTAVNMPPSDKLFYPFYELCIEARRPVLIMVGYTGWGSGVPGGNGLLLEYDHPKYLENVAAKFPSLEVIAGRPAWPWQTEMIATLRHKTNILNELHGWSPKYFSDELKHQIGHQLQDRILFGADYPMFTYERLFRDWESLGYTQDVLEKIYYKNAQNLLERLGITL